MKAKVNPWDKIHAARLADIDLARRFLADQGRYAGLMLEWARLVLINEQEELSKIGR